MPPLPFSPDSVHLAHHWWVAHRGGERVLEEMAALFPEAGISTLFLDRATLTPAMAARRWQVSPLGRIAPRFVPHRHLLAFYPWAVRRLHVPPGTRLLLSSDAAVIKGLRKPPGCLHVCYCHSPPRYLWEMSGEYLQRTAGLGPAGRQIFRRVIPGLREWDRVAAAEVDVFVANSQFVAGRIRRCYGREATVIYPPVDAGRFAPVGDPGDAYLVVAELVAYKRVDLAVAVCTHTHRRLVVVGVGPELARLRRLAGSTVEFAGRKSEAEVAGLMARCRALLHPQIEDFGIAAVEAQAAGRPVIAYRGGGALETVVEGTTGLFFEAQEEAALAAALDVFESAPPRFASEACARQARRFAPEVFRSELSRLLSALPAP